MIPKKNPNKDLRNNSGLFFSFGLCLMLFLTWRLLEWRTYKQFNYEHSTIAVENLLELEIPVTEHIKALPPPTSAQNF